MSNDFKKTTHGMLDKDFMDIINSSDFQQYDPNTARLALHGARMTLTGDLRSINIGRFNQVSLAVTIDNKPNIICKSTEVRVDVPASMKDEVLKLKPDTGLVLVVKYNKMDVIVDTFELVEIKEYNLDLHYAYCVCIGDNPNPNSGSDICHRIFGYTKDDYANYCPICGSKVAYFNNVYSDDFMKHFKIASRGY